MKYLIGSGYCHRPNAAKAESMFTTWMDNVYRHARPMPERIVVICVGGAVPAIIRDDVDVIQLAGNCGHGHHLLGIEQPPKPHAYSGWSASALATAMVAYAAECDFIWKESDCLCFGPWVQQLYADLGKYDIIFGGQMHSAPYMPSSQSLFLVKHAAIPAFVRTYLSQGDERDPSRLVEHKFRGLAGGMKCTVLGSTFVDRMRPLPYDSPVWSAQQFSDDELEELKRRNLI